MTSNINSSNNYTNNISLTTPSNKKMITVKKRQSNRRGNYILGETIGKGAFAKVKLATHVPTQEKVAIKILDKQKLISNELNINNDVIRIKKEINILKQLRHKNIIQLYEIMESQTTLYIVMEYCEGKELFDYIIKRKHLNEREACRFLQQIINGVEYLHLMNVTHRDLKPENLLLDSKRRIKISDFGLSTMSQDETSLLQTPCGTPSYAPPEMLRGDEYDGALSDVWSCGIILYTMLCGNLPCAESKEELIYQTIMTHNYDFPSYVSPGAIDLINNMLQINPKERFTFSQIKNHPWFNLVEPQLKPGLLVGIQRIPIDEEVLEQVEKGGYDKEECKTSIIENKYDALTAFYYLRLKQMSKEGKSSVSDLFSEEYVRYICDKSNWENPEKIKLEKYKDYLNYNNGYGYDMNYYGNGGFVNKYGLYSNNNNNSNKVNNNNNNFNNYHNIRVLRYNEALASTGMHVNKKLFNNKQYVKKKEQYTLKLSSDTLPNELKSQIVSSLNKSCDNFKYQFELIDHIDNLPLKNNQSVSQFNTSNNVISLIADKLIMSSVFGKYLSNVNKPNFISFPETKDNSDSELVDKFYTLQKYKNLVEIIKSKRNGIFPKKIYDWNYTAFDEFLNDEEDYVFSDNFMKNSLYANFIQKNQRGLRNIRNNSRMSNSLLKSERRHPSIPSVNNFTYINNKSILNNSAYYKRSKRYSIGSCSVNKNRKNKFVSISSYIGDNYEEIYQNKPNIYSYTNNNTNVNYDYNNTQYNINTSTDKNKKLTSYINIPKQKENNTTTNKKQAQFKFKISSSTMNDISEDEELFCNIHNSSIVSSYTGRHSYNTSINHNYQKELIESNTNNSNNNKEITNQVSYTALATENNNPNNNSIEMYNIKHNLQSSRMNNTSTNKALLNIKNNIDVSFYLGPIDIRCILFYKINDMLLNMKNFFKKMDYFYNVKGNKIKCTKANLSIEMEITKIHYFNNPFSEYNYLKIKLKNGDSINFHKVINEMLSTIFT